jgi:hypothetical protein
MTRADDLRRFYGLLARLEERLGGARTFAEMGAFRDWPERGVYIFFEPSEKRSATGAGARVVRVGTHALTLGSRSTLRQRLMQHRGLAAGGGNHRGSIFRLLVGQALLARGDLPPCPSWGRKGDLRTAALALELDPENIAAAERPIEEAVTRYIGCMPFLWLSVDDCASPQSMRGYIERNAIALLSNYDRPAIDPASKQWLGLSSNRPAVRRSGLWNQRHVNEWHDASFLDAFEDAIAGRSCHDRVS